MRSRAVQGAWKGAWVYRFASAAVLCVAVASAGCSGASSTGQLGSGEQRLGGFPVQGGMLVMDLGERGAVRQYEVDALNQVLAGARPDEVRREWSEKIGRGEVAGLRQGVDTVGTKRLRLGFSVLGGEAVQQAEWRAAQGLSAADRVQGVVDAAGRGDDGFVRVPWRALWGCEARQDRCRYLVLQAEGSVALEPGTRYQVTLDQTGQVQAAQARLVAAITTESGPNQGLDIPKLGSFQADGFSGNASAQLAFEVPAGPGGFGPSVGIAYSSLRANHAQRYAGVNEKDDDGHDIPLNDIRKRVSDVGRGWELQGGGYVQGTTMVLDGVSHTLNTNGSSTVRYSGLRIERSSADPNVPAEWVRVTDTQGTVFEFGLPAGFSSPGRAGDFSTAMQGEYNCAGHHVGLANTAECEKKSQHELRTKLMHFGRNRLQAMYPWTLTKWVGGALRPYRLLLARKTDRFGNQVHYFYHHEAARSGQGLNAPYQTHARLSRIVWSADPTKMSNTLTEFARVQASAGKETTSGGLGVDRAFRIPDCGPGQAASYTPTDDPDTWRRIAEGTGAQPHTFHAGDGELTTETSPYCSLYGGQQGTPITTELQNLEAALDQVSPRLEVRFSYAPRRDGVEPSLQQTYGTHSFTTKALREVRVIRVTPQDQVVTLHRYELERDGGGIATGGKLLDADEYKITSIDRVNFPVVDEKRDRTLRTQWGNLTRVTHYVGTETSASPPLQLAYHGLGSDTPEPARGLLHKVQNGYGGEQEFAYASVAGARDDSGLSSDAKKGIRAQYVSVVTDVTHRDTVLGTSNSTRYVRDATWAQGVVQNQWGGSRVVMTEVRQQPQGATAARLESCTETRYYTNLVHIGESDANGYRFAIPGLAGGDQPSLHRSGLVAGMGNTGFEKALGGLAYETVRWKRASDTACPALAAHNATTSITQGAYEAQHTFVSVVKMNDGDDDSYQVRPVDTYQWTFNPHGGSVTQNAAWMQHTQTAFDGYMNPTEVKQLVRGPAQSDESLVSRTTYTYQPVVAGVASDGTFEHNLIRLQTSATTESFPDGVVRSQQTTAYWKESDQYTAKPQRMTTAALATSDSGSHHAECASTPQDVAVTLGYDAYGQLTSTTTAAGATTVSQSRTVYHGASSGLWGLVASTSETRGALSTTTELSYDTLLRPVGSKGPFQQGASVGIPQTSVQYDALGRVSASTNMLTGVTERVEYLSPNSASQLCSGKRDPHRGASWRTCTCTEYSGDRKRCTLQASSGTGLGFWSVDERDYQLTQKYDGLGRVMEASAPYAQSAQRATKTEYAPHAPGGADSVTWNPDGTWVQSCSAVGSVLATEQRAGAGTQLPSCAAHADASNNLKVKRQEYSARGQFTRSVEYNGASEFVTSFGYDDAGRLRTVTDALARNREYRYDRAGRRVYSSDPDAREKYTCYDEQGRATQHSTAESRAAAHAAAESGSMGWTRTTYDDAGRVLGTQAPGGIATTHVYLDQTVNASHYGRLLSMTSTDSRGFSSTHALAYNAIGQVQDDTLQQDGLALRVRSVYDASTQQLTCREYPAATASGPSSTGRFSLRYSYDPATGRLRRVASAACGCTDSCVEKDVLPDGFQTYYPDGSVASVHYADGSVDQVSRDMTTGRTTASSHFWRGWKAQQSKLSYDVLGRVSQDEQSLLQLPVPDQNPAQATYATFTSAYQYDGLDRVTEFSVGDVRQTFAYDALGNRTQGPGADYGARVAFVPNTGLVGSRTRDDSMAQLAYDALGRVTVIQERGGSSSSSPAIHERERYFGPTGLSKLVMHLATEPAGSSVQTRTLTFAPHGLELEQTDHANVQRVTVSAPTASITLEWVNGQTHSAASFPSATACGAPNCLYLPIVQGGTGGGGVPAPTVTANATTEPALRSVAHRDLLGSTSLLSGISRSLLEPASQSTSRQVQPNAPLQPSAWLEAVASDASVDSHVSLRPAFTPFGEALNPDARSPVLLSSFASHRGRETSPLVDMGARIYDPSLGRFLQPDPVIADPTASQDYNAYAYVRNNPTHLTDPTGMWPDWGGIGGALQQAWNGASSTAQNVAGYYGWAFQDMARNAGNPSYWLGDLTRFAQDTAGMLGQGASSFGNLMMGGYSNLTYLASGRPGPSPYTWSQAGADAHNVMNAVGTAHMIAVGVQGAAPIGRSIASSALSGVKSYYNRAANSAVLPIPVPKAVASGRVAVASVAEGDATATIRNTPIAKLSSQLLPIDLKYLTREVIAKERGRIEKLAKEYDPGRSQDGISILSDVGRAEPRNYIYDGMHRALGLMRRAELNGEDPFSVPVSALPEQFMNIETYTHNFPLRDIHLQADMASVYNRLFPR
jgi:RHS repeat-associated protein